MKPSALVLAVCSLIAHAAPPTTKLANLPNSTVSTATTDAAGNIYLAGYQGTLPAAAAFVAKLSPTGIWQVELDMTGAETGAIPLSLSVGGVPVRDMNLTVWVK